MSYWEDHNVEHPETGSKTASGADLRDFMAPAPRRRSQDDTDRLLGMFAGLGGSDSERDRDRLLDGVVSRILSDVSPQSREAGASQAFIDSLPAVDVPADSRGDSCGICMDPLPAVVRGLPCRHLFHAGCLVHWLKVSHKCPACRREFPTEDKARSRPIVVADEEEDDSMYG
ncbi:hypothetical protein DFJ74DRAFT_662574 [Hyaloraphidium curvatum]|nr:hypothetical protein DFJ74DRAFT_662574 [Hyaloraphidium curvatum]